MAYSTLLAQIKSAVEGVSNIGVVRDYVRSWSSDREFLDLFQTTVGSTDQIRGWTITRDAVQNVRYTTGGQHQVQHLFVIRGYLGMQDGTATEKTFQALIDLVVDALDDKITLSNNVRTSGPVTVPTIAHAEFGTVTCHYAEIHFPVTEHVLRTYS